MRKKNWKKLKKKILSGSLGSLTDFPYVIILPSGKSSHLKITTKSLFAIPTWPLIITYWSSSFGPRDSIIRTSSSKGSPINFYYWLINLFLFFFWKLS